MFERRSIFYNIISVFLLLITSVCSISAQEVKVSASIDSNSIVIGQQTRLRLKLQFSDPKKVKVAFPEVLDTLRKEVEIVAKSNLDTLPANKEQYKYTLYQDLFITSFDSGYWAIPPFKFNVNLNDTNSLYTEPLLLQVSTVTVDTTQAIKDIKAPYEVDYSWIDWLKDNMYVVYGALILIVLIVIIILLIRYFRKVPPQVIVVEAPKIPAHIIALEKIEKLKSEKLWQEGKLKLYHSELTDILREYIENRFKIPAMEQTTDEILFGFRNVAIDNESMSKLKQVLLLADLVKFAKEHPLPNENELSMSNAVDFINGTKKEEEIKK
ncbi:MAG: hypothetical protein L6Q66_06505 [Bacteroidia bacterium]|nr:hypothetical protein [Bacteroidia bacterium]